jgi:hypothetical protein
VAHTLWECAHIVACEKRKRKRSNYVTAGENYVVSFPHGAVYFRRGVSLSWCVRYATQIIIIPFYNVAVNNTINAFKLTRTYTMKAVRSSPLS